MFPLVNPGGWHTGDELTAAQINQLDTQQSRALDGTGGSGAGVYTPTSPINIGGQGLKLSGSGAAQWVQVPGITVRKQHPVTVLLVNNKASNNTLWTGATSGGFGYLGPVLTGPQSGTSWSVSGACAIWLEPPCDGAIVTDVVVVSRYLFPSGAPANLTVGQYSVIYFDAATVGAPAQDFNTGGANDNHTLSNATNYTSTDLFSVTPWFLTSAAVNLATQVPVLWIANGWGDTQVVQLQVISIQSTWTINQLQTA